MLDIELYVILSRGKFEWRGLVSEEAVYFYTVSAVVVGAGFAPGCGADSERRRAGGDRQSGETGIDRQKRASERSAAVSPPSLHSLYLSTLSPPPLSLSLSLSLYFFSLFSALLAYH